MTVTSKIAADLLNLLSFFSSEASKISSERGKYPRRGALFPRAKRFGPYPCPLPPSSLCPHGGSGLASLLTHAPLVPRNALAACLFTSRRSLEHTAPAACVPQRVPRNLVLPLPAMRPAGSSPARGSQVRQLVWLDGPPGTILLAPPKAMPTDTWSATMAQATGLRVNSIRPSALVRADTHRRAVGSTA